MKKNLKIATLSILALSGAFIAPISNNIASAQVPTAVQNHVQESTLSIAGNAYRQIAPDYAVLNLGIVTTGDTVSAAKTENDAILSSLIAKLLKLGIPKANLTTQNFSVNPEYAYNDRTQKSSINGYTVNNSISVKIDDLDQVSRVIDLAASCHINEINSLQFFNNQQQVLEDQLMAEAVADAKHSAEVMAKALDMKIVGVKEVSTYPIRTLRNNQEVYARALNSATPIESGSLSLQKSVNITFLLSAK